MRRLRENLAYKILALVLSVALWSYVKLNQDPLTVQVPLRLEMRGLPDNLVATPAKSQVNAVVTGPKIYASRVTPDSFTATLDLRDKGAGQYKAEVAVIPRDRLRSIVQVESVQPDKVDVRLQQKARKSVRVEVAWQGEPVSGTRYGTPHVSPATVEVSGADSQVALVDHVVVSAPAGSAHVNDRYPASPVDAHGKPVAEVTLSPDAVAVDVTLLHTQETRLVNVSLAWTGAIPPGYEVKDVATNPQTVTISGPPEALRRISAIPTRPVPLKGVMGSVTQRVALSPPPGIFASPPTVIARLRVAKQR